VHDGNDDAVTAEAFGELFCNGDTAVLASCATHGQRCVVLALPGVTLLVTM
jgi:hypothetical protein